MRVEIIFMDTEAPKVMEVDNVYTKGGMLCLRYGNMITKYPLDHIFSVSHEHGAHIGSKAHYDKYINQGIVREVYYGEMTHKRTVFVGDFKYKDMVFTIHYDFGYDYPEETAIFAFEDGLYSCDCNRSLIIQEEYGEDAIDKLNCGKEIEMINYSFEYLD